MKAKETQAQMEYISTKKRIYERWAYQKNISPKSDYFLGNWVNTFVKSESDVSQ